MKADLHIHTVLSPCGDIEMTPLNIVARAKEIGLSLIGITDHNTTRQCKEIKKVALREGIHTLCGAEITTKEEVHVLAFADGDSNLELLQDYIDTHLPQIQNDEDIFGYQLQVNENEEVVYCEERMLINAINQSIEEVERFVHSIGGIFIPAHLDRSMNSVISQLGYLPPDLRPDAVEISYRTDVGSFIGKHKYLSGYGIIQSSDAHYPDDIGRAYINLNIDEFSFDALKKALKNSYCYE